MKIHGIEIIQSNLFPFELHWDACDIITKELIMIPSGEWVHGVIVPKMEIESIPLRFAPEINDSPLRYFMFKDNIWL
jgi:hypothetical protein